MKFVCPSCAVSNRVPDKCAGITIICRGCKTQVTAPTRPPGPLRPWLLSPGWLTVAILELAALAGLVVSVGALVWSKPPAGLPCVAGPADVGLQLAAPGSVLVLAWETGHPSVGGYYQIANPNATLLRGSGDSQMLVARAVGDPWPPSLLDSKGAPPSRPVAVTMEVDLPADGVPPGQKVTLHASAAIEYPGQARAGGPVEIKKAAVEHDYPVQIATEDEVAALDGYRARQNAARWGVFSCAMIAVAVGVGALALAQKRVSIMCPKCGRVTSATFYHEGGDYRVTPCPHV